MTRRGTSSLGRRLRSLYSWHRWLGIAAALFLLVFAITGIALNHSTRLGFDQHYLQQPFWQSLYQLDQNIAVSGIENNGHWFSQADGRLYFDQTHIGHGSAPNAVLRFESFWVMASTNELRLIDDQGAVLETITAEQLPGRILNLGRVGEQLVIDSQYADFIGNIDNLNWQATRLSTPLSAAVRQTPPDDLVRSIRQDGQAHAITIERILLDIHNGRLFGLVGVVVMDSAAIALIALSVSGLLLWISYRRKQRARKQRSRQKH